MSTRKNSNSDLLVVIEVGLSEVPSRKPCGSTNVIEI
jgi:hypothetical protein